MTSRLDPDHLAALVEERKFLLASLDDLDAEHAVGDMDDADYQSLKDDYTRRTAEVIRAIDEQRAAFASTGGMSNRQRLATLLGVLVIASLAGVMLARTVGFRSEADSASGGVFQTTAGLLAEAETLTLERQWDEALVVYDEVLENQPSNVEALTYRGWIRFLTGDAPGAEDSLADAIATDAEYPDARVFRALVFNGQGKIDEAYEEIRVLDGLDVPPEAQELLDGANLRATVLAALVERDFGGANDAISLDLIDAELPTVIDAASILQAQGSVSLALRLRDGILDSHPDNVPTLIAQGQQLATSADIVAALPETAARGLTLLDRAVELDPESVDALVARGVGRLVQGDREGSLDDLALLDALVEAGTISDPLDVDYVEQFRAAFDG